VRSTSASMSGSGTPVFPSTRMPSTWQTSKRASTCSSCGDLAARLAADDRARIELLQPPEHAPRALRDIRVARGQFGGHRDREAPPPARLADGQVRIA
jgi:hypothetical protein